jgi:hypothetical protein
MFVKIGEGLCGVRPIEFDEYPVCARKKKGLVLFLLEIKRNNYGSFCTRMEGEMPA